MSYERFFALTVDLCCIADTDGFIRVVNPAWERVLGWTPEEMKARPYLERVHPDDVAATVEAAGALARGETVLRLVNRIRCKQGGYRRLEWCSVAPAGDGMIYATARDITEASRDPDVTARREAAEALRRSEEWHRLAQSAAGIGIMAWDLPTGLLTWDAYCWHILGYPPEARTMPLDEMRRAVHPDDRARAEATLEDSFREGRSHDVEFRFPNAAGDYVWLRVRGDVVRRSDDGTPLRVVGTLTDISAAKEVQAETARRGQRLDQLLSASPATVYATNVSKTRLTYMSANARELFGAPPEEILGDPGWWLGALHPDDRCVAVERVAAWLAAGGQGILRHSYRMRRGDGSYVWVEDSVRAVTDGDGEVSEIFGAMIDITERKRQEQAIKAARERAESASLAKSRFLANMSHEIRTPLNGLLGMADLLDRAIANPAHKKLIAVMQESGELLLSIINDVLDMSKIEAGKLTIEEIPFRPLDLVRKIESIHTLKATERGVSLSVLTTSRADRPRLGDPHRILQILHNLVGNAIKFTERGSVSVSVYCDVDRPLRVEVRDTGIGMTEEQLSRVFEDFEQAETGTSRRFGGTGLGMSIVRRLVTLMRGEITIDSRPGEGTRVVVELPLGFPAEAPEGPSPVAEATTGEVAGLQVLAVDDNEINRTVLRAMLDELATTTTMVASGRAAVEAAGGARFDVLLLDISMPDMDGVETLRAIRAAEAASGREPTPAIAVTANAFHQQIVDYLRAGFDGHLAKPIRARELSAALLAVVRGAGA